MAQKTEKKWFSVVPAGCNVIDTKEAISYTNSYDPHKPMTRRKFLRIIILFGKRLCGRLQGD